MLVLYDEHWGSNAFENFAAKRRAVGTELEVLLC